MAHRDKVEAAKKAVRDVFGDTSVGRSQTRDSLAEIMEDIQSMLSAMDEDDPQGR